MKITHIAGTNIKGKTFAHDLAQSVTVFTGLNGQGKSARLDAIQLALFGVHPALSKTNEGVMQLCSGSIMSAEVRLSDGSKASNYWNQTKSGTSCKGEGAVTKSITPLCLNPAEYFDLSDRERTKLVFKLCKSSTNFRNEVVAQAKSVKLEDHDASAEEIVNSVCGKVSAHEPQMGDSSTEWLESLAEMVKKQVSTTMAAARRMSATLAGLSELRAMVNQPVNNAAERELASVNAQIGEIDLKIRELELGHAEMRKKLARKAEIEVALNAPQTASLADARDAVSALESEVGGFQSKLPQLKADLSIAESELAALNRELVRTENLIEQAEKHRAAMQEANEILLVGGAFEVEMNELKSGALKDYDHSVSPESSVREAAQQVESSKSSVAVKHSEVKSAERRVERIKADLSQYDSVEECDHCHWKIRLTNGLTEELAKEESQLAILRESLNSCELALGVNEALLATAKADMEKYRAHQQSLQAARTKLFEMESRKKWAVQLLQSQSTVAPAGSVEEVQAQVTAATSKVAALKKAIAETRGEEEQHKVNVSNLAKARKLVQSLQEEADLRNRLQGELESLAGVAEPSTVELENLRLSRATLSSRVPALSLEMRQSMAARGEAATKLIAAEEALKVSREEKVWREVKKIVDDVQAKAVQESVGPIISAANAICEGLLPTPLAMHEGVIGRFGDRKFITTDTFNKSDQQIAFAAICVALAGASGCPLKLLLMDDLDNIEDDRLFFLMNKVLHAIKAGVVTQMIGCSVRQGIFTEVEGVEVIVL